VFRVWEGELDSIWVQFLLNFVGDALRVPGLWLGKDRDAERVPYKEKPHE